MFCGGVPVLRTSDVAIYVAVWVMPRHVPRSLVLCAMCRISCFLAADLRLNVYEEEDGTRNKPIAFFCCSLLCALSLSPDPPDLLDASHKHMSSGTQIAS